MNPTTRYVRASGQWVKITRNPAQRSFTLVQGWEGEVQGRDIRIWPFAYMPTWADAEQSARRMIADHA